MALKALWLCCIDEFYSEKQKCSFLFEDAPPVVACTEIQDNKTFQKEVVYKDLLYRVNFKSIFSQIHGMFASFGGVFLNDNPFEYSFQFFDSLINLS